MGKAGEKRGKVAKSEIFFAKWPPAAILDVRKSLSIAFLAISDRYATLIFWIFFKMAAGRHFGSPFWGILDDRKSLSIAFLTISDRYGSPICAKNNRVLPLCVINGYAKYEVDRWICDTVRDATSFLIIFIQNGRQRPFCLNPIDDKSHRVLVIWDLTGYGEYEFDRCICDKVMACTSVDVRRRRRRRRLRWLNENHNIHRKLTFLVNIMDIITEINSWFRG